MTQESTPSTGTTSTTGSGSASGAGSASILLTKPDASLPDLAQRIKTYHAGVLDAARNVVGKAIQAGLLLKEAKAKVPYGEWLSWLKDHCELSERTAHRYMQLAANQRKIDEALKGKSATMATLSLNKALRAIETKPDLSAGAWSKYAKTQEALIKRLQDLLPDDVEAAAKQTIGELQKFLPEKPPLAKVS